MTLRHVVAWTLASEDPAERAEHAAGIRQRLIALEGVVPSIRRIEVGIDEIAADAPSAATVVADFDDAEGLQQYIVHPEHQAAAAWIRTVIADRIAVDWTV